MWVNRKHVHIRSGRWKSEFDIFRKKKKWNWIDIRANYGSFITVFYSSDVYLWIVCLLLFEQPLLYLTYVEPIRTISCACKINRNKVSKFSSSSFNIKNYCSTLIDTYGLQFRFDEVYFPTEFLCLNGKDKITRKEMDRKPEYEKWSDGTATSISTIP